MDIRDIGQMDEQELQELLEPSGKRRLSLHMTLQQEPDKRRENLIRLKNLVRRAEEQLEAYDLDSQTVRLLLEPLKAIIEGPTFPTRLGEGLAIFLEEGQQRAYTLPWKPAKEQALASHYYYVRSLLPAFSDPHFFILDLSQDGIRLLRAGRYGVERVELPDEVPQTLAEGLQWDDPEKQLQWHTGTGNEMATGRAALYHGHGVSADESKKDDIQRYFHLLDAKLSDVLADKTDPLVLVGVDYLLPLYEAANTYPHLVEEGVTGNYQHRSDEELRELVWPEVAPRFQEAKSQALERYGSLTAQQLATDDLTEVLAMAYQGRVETLFIDPEAQRWGDFGGSRESVMVRETQEPGDEELLNLAVIFTLQNGGAIYLTDRDSMPNHKPAAAALRF